MRVLRARRATTRSGYSGARAFQFSICGPLLDSQSGDFAAGWTAAAQSLSLSARIFAAKRNNRNEQKDRTVRVRKPGARQAMNDSAGSVTIRVHAAISESPAAAWDACAGAVNPTVSHT